MVITTHMMTIKLVTESTSSIIEAKLDLNEDTISLLLFCMAVFYTDKQKTLSGDRAFCGC